MEKAVNSGMTNKVRSHFKKVHDALVSEEGRKILVSHNGTFSQELVGSLSNGVEELLISKGDRKIVIKRMFSILLEGLQNIRLHGILDDDDQQLAFLIIGACDEDYKIILANMIERSDEEKITHYLRELNDYPPEVLKEKYLAVLSNEFISSKGGAGLGLITTRMKSGPLNHEFHQLSDSTSLFILEVTLDRIKK